MNPKEQIFGKISRILNKNFRIRKNYQVFGKFALFCVARVLLMKNYSYRFII